jgi:hypothetical protein
MKKLLLVLLMVLGWAGAQTGDKVREELKRTDEAIRVARPIVEQSQNEEALKTLENAVQVQKIAWDNFANQRYKRAYDQTMNARSLVRKAISLAGLTPERIRGELARTREIMDELGPAIRRSSDPRALEFWKMAQGEQASAEEQFRSQRYGLALKFTFAARLHVRNAWGILRSLIDPERVRAELDRTDELLERAREATRNVREDILLQLLDKAASLQQQARTALDNRLFGLAIKYTLAARDLILRAWEKVRGAQNPTLVERALAETDKLIEDWAPLIGQSDNTEAARLLEQAQQLQASARADFAAGRLKPAFTQTCQARRLMQQAIELYQSGNEQEDN